MFKIDDTRLDFHNSSGFFAEKTNMRGVKPYFQPASRLIPGLRRSGSDAKPAPRPPSIHLGNQGPLSRYGMDLLRRAAPNQRPRILGILREDRRALRAGLELPTAKFAWWNPAATAAINAQYEHWRAGSNASKARASGWFNDGVRDACLADLMSYLTLSDRRILDLGCGPAPLLGMLQQSGVPFFSYTGVDVSEGALAEARATYAIADGSINFMQADCFRMGQSNAFEVEPGQFDVIFASRIFALRPQHWTPEAYNTHMLAAISYYASRAREGFLFNFLPPSSTLASAPDIAYKTAVPHLVNRMALALSLAKRGFAVYANPSSYLTLSEQTSFLVVRDPGPPKPEAKPKTKPTL